MSRRSANGWEFSGSVIEKAQRYLKLGRVTRDPRVPGCYWVKGGDPARDYRVQTDADPEAQTATWITCTCTHGTTAGGGAARCSHAVAVLVATRARSPLEVRSP